MVAKTKKPGLFPAGIELGVNGAQATRSDPIAAGGGIAIGNVVEITQAAYDALGAPDDETLYLING